MRIAQVAPLTESVPPKCYGGTERVVSWLTEELVRQGHDVTLFASGDSITEAKLVPACDEALRTSKKYKDPLARHLLLINEVIKRASEFDLIHSHIDYLLFPFLRGKRLRSLHTLHGRLDLPDLAPIYDEFWEIPVVSISDNQRKPLPMAHWFATVHHGLPANLYSFVEKPADYFLFLGRICPEKRPDRAIEIANRTKKKLVIAAKIDPVDKKYFAEQIEPMLKSPYVDFIGEVTEDEKNELIGKARALVFPIDWPEPFGLVLIESLACGTPVIAFNHGSVSEIIDHGVTGYHCTDLEQAVAAVHKIDEIDRKQCRAVFDRRFTTKRMADDYVNLYARLLGHRTEAQHVVPFAARNERTASVSQL
jgi:glycosyltransferase involved in cell wall biosynthesis